MHPLDQNQATHSHESGEDPSSTPNLLERLRRWPRHEPSPGQRAAEAERWQDTVHRRRRDGRPRRVLFIHGQLPGETGSGVYLQNIARESIRQGIDMFVLSAGYETLDDRHIHGVPADRIYTCPFTPPGETPVPGAVKTPISGMSVVMPYPVLAYRDRTEDELLDLLDVFGSRIADLVDQLQPDVVRLEDLVRRT